jgi:hypothetical protein
MVGMTTFTLQPEFFALMGIDLFLVLSLLTCLLDERFPKPIPYIYQIAAVYGFGDILISRNFMDIFGEYTRFWYSFLYLIVALANIIAVNVYFAILKRQYTVSMIWSGAVTLPSILVTLYFMTQYSSMQNYMPSITQQLGLLISASALAITISILIVLSIIVRPGIIRKLLSRRKEVSQ